MRFQSNVRPVLTPLGQRLITLSERKLYSLEPPVGGRDEPNLLKGVLIQESVKSAWRSVERGQQVQVNDWQSTNAMGLDVIGEEEEELDEVEQEERNERWFEELVQSLGDDDDEEDHEWAESEVGSAVDEDDFEYYEDFEHYTLPSPPPTSPIHLPSSSISPVAVISASTIEVESTALTTVHIEAAMDLIEVDGYTAGIDVFSGPVRRDSVPSTPLLSATRSPTMSPIIPMSLVGDGFDSDTSVIPLSLQAQGQAASFVEVGPAYIDSIPSQPLLSAACSPLPTPVPDMSLADDDLDCDDFTLPPALHRCSSTSSIPCDCEDLEDDDDCHTPPLTYGDLDNSIGGLLALHIDDDGQVLDDPGDVHHFVIKRSRMEQGLGLDVGIDLVDIL